MRRAALVVALSLVVGCGHPRSRPQSVEARGAPAPPQDFLPSEEIYRARLALSCAEPQGSPVGLSGGRPNWDGIHGDVDESGRLIAWLEATDTASQATSESSSRTFARRRYSFRLDDVDSGATVHRLALPELPALMARGACATWVSSSRADGHRRAIDEVDRVLAPYTFRRLHPHGSSETPLPEDQRQAALELLRRPSDPKGDWSHLPALPYATTQDDRPRSGALFAITTARDEDPPMTAWPLTVALRCSAIFQGVDCAGPESLIVFRSKSKAVKLSRPLRSNEDPKVLCDQGRVTYIAGLSPRRRLVVLGESAGVFDEHGQSPDEDCFGVSAAERYTALRFDP